MGKAKATEYYSQSTRVPVTCADDLTEWWMPSGLDDNKYRIYKVQVLKKSSSKLEINLAGDNWVNHPKRNQKVDLDLNKDVYAGLPSTALLAEPGQYAFLLLSDEFILKKTQIKEADLDAYADGDEKWPFGAAGLMGKRRRLRKPSKKKTAKRAKKA